MSTPPNPTRRIPTLCDPNLSRPPQRRTRPPLKVGGAPQCGWHGSRLLVRVSPRELLVRRARRPSLCKRTGRAPPGLRPALACEPFDQAFVGAMLTAAAAGGQLPRLSHSCKPILALPPPLLRRPRVPWAPHLGAAPCPAGSAARHPLLPQVPPCTRPAPGRGRGPTRLAAHRSSERSISSTPSLAPPAPALSRAPRAARPQICRLATPHPTRHARSPGPRRQAPLSPGIVGRRWRAAGPRPSPAEARARPPRGGPA
jgi:hypothetical protein